MKRPTITKLQAINALVALKVRDYEEQHKIWSAAHNLLEQSYEDEVHRLLRDPVRLERALNGTDSDGGAHLKILSSATITLQLDSDERVTTAMEAVDTHYRSQPEYIRESEISSMLEDKLTGCDPESLLSVPENVANMRALLNGLQLLPESYESLSA